MSIESLLHPGGAGFSPIPPASSTNAPSTDTPATTEKAAPSTTDNTPTGSLPLSEKAHVSPGDAAAAGKAAPIDATPKAADSKPGESNKDQTRDAGAANDTATPQIDKAGTRVVDPTLKTPDAPVADDKAGKPNPAGQPHRKHHGHHRRHLKHHHHRHRGHHGHGHHAHGGGGAAVRQGANNAAAGAQGQNAAPPAAAPEAKAGPQLDPRLGADALGKLQALAEGKIPPAQLADATKVLKGATAQMAKDFPKEFGDPEGAERLKAMNPQQRAAAVLGHYAPDAQVGPQSSLERALGGTFGGLGRVVSTTFDRMVGGASQMFDGKPAERQVAQGQERKVSAWGMTFNG